MSFLGSDMYIDKKIVRYGMSKDRKGLKAYLKDGSWYHTHSDELSDLEKWIQKLLLESDKWKKK